MTSTGVSTVTKVEVIDIGNQETRTQTVISTTETEYVVTKEVTSTNPTTVTSTKVNIVPGEATTLIVTETDCTTTITADSQPTQEPATTTTSEGTTSTETTAAATSAVGEDCSTLTGDAKANCLNTNFAAGLFTNTADECTHGDIGCDANGGYAICNWGSWVVQGCAAGTTCYAQNYGTYIYIGCNWPKQ